MAAARGQERSYEIDLPAQPVAEALNQVSTQTDTPVLFPYDLVAERQANTVVGRYTVREAVGLLLEGTGLSGRLSAKGVLMITPAQANATTSGERALNDNKQAGEQSGRGRASSLISAIAALLTSAGASPDAAAQGDAAEGGQRGTLEEIVVTAQKRVENLMDVPIPVTALSADTLVNSNQLSVRDYFIRVPGLSLTGTNTFSRPSLAIRGLTTAGSYSNPTVAIMVDDVPFGASQGLGGGTVFPDIDPSNLQRIEVLRGPQGTLYGASSIGGVIKYETVEPSTDGVTAAVQAGTLGIANGDGLGYSLRASANIPLTDDLAALISGYRRERPGYVDQPGAGLEDVNRSDTRGARLSTLWEPTDVLSVKLAAMLQYSNDHGSAGVSPDVDGFRQDDTIRAEKAEAKMEAYSATITAALGRVDLVSITGYNVNDFSDVYDITNSVYGDFTEALFGVTGTLFTDDNKTRKWTQELRLTSAIGDRIDWMLGAFYTDEDSSYIQENLVIDDDGEQIGNAATYDFPSTLTERSLFGNVTFRATDRLDLQVGMRNSWIEQTYKEINTGPYIPLFFGGTSEMVVAADAETDDSSFTFLVTPRFKVSDDFMVYGRVASGYRAGGPNASCSVLGVPCTFEPDTTNNYEIGTKRTALDGALVIDASVYYIDWRDIQIPVRDPVTGFNYIGNAGKARSQGVELSLEARPNDQLTVAGWVAWSEAELDEDFPDGGVNGISGERLPFSTEWSGSLSVDREWFVTDDTIVSFGATASYVDERMGDFTQSAPRVVYPDYTKVDLRATLSHESWKASLFVNNLTDERKAIETIFGGRVIYLEPRTFGVNLSRSF